MQMLNRVTAHQPVSLTVDRPTVHPINWCSTTKGVSQHFKAFLA